MREKKYNRRSKSNNEKSRKREMNALRAGVVLNDFRIVSKNNGLHSAHICFFEALLMVSVNIFYIEIVSLKVEAPKA